MEQLQKNRVTTFLVGSLEGFWRFEDFRVDHCIIGCNAWEESLKKSGFENTVVFPCFNGRHGLVTSWAAEKEPCNDSNLTEPESGSDLKEVPTWLLFGSPSNKLVKYLQKQLYSAGRRIFLVQPSDGSDLEENPSNTFHVRTNVKSDFEQLMETLKSRKVPVEGVIFLWSLDTTRTKQDEILQPYLYIVQTIFLLNQKLTPRFYAVTQGIAPVGDTDLSNFPASTLWGFTKSLKNEVMNMNCRCISIAHADTNLSEREMNEVYLELWSDDKESQVAYVNGFRHVPRFQPLKATVTDLALPSGSNRFQLILPETKSFADLLFGPMEALNLKPEEIEIQVYASALNFRDIFAVLKPMKYFDSFNPVGFDFSGVVKRIGPQVTKWKVGDYVLGVNKKDKALPSHVSLHEKDVMRVPGNMTFCEAATLPSVVATCYSCLIDIANITKEDTVLIHIASGGVGLCTIQFLQSVGSNIIATAGSRRKQNYLRSLGIKHIFSSRNTDYGDLILEVTNGRGVDVVLNSLTGEGFKEATLRACAEGARFVEIGKWNVWKPEEVQTLRPDVKYSQFDLTATVTSQDDWRTSLKKLEELVEKNIISPIPYVRFDALNIGEALQYMQKAKHIGKVVCVMPQLQMEDGVLKPITPMFSEKSTYLITGGLGGIGLEVAKWMRKKGAKHILLAGRSPPTTSVQTVIDRLNSEGANLIPVQLDVGNYDECRRLLESINQKDGMNLPQLKGIMHAAGTLSDGLISNQEWSKFSETFSAKVAGTLNLHELTMGYQLEHFVMFSSVCSLFGSPGQSNHAAANCFEDALAQYRHSVGLCATAINWGQWGEVGVAIEVDFAGMKTLSTLQGISALEYAMKTQRVQTAVMNMESFVLFSKLSPQTAIYLDERIWKAGCGSSTSMAIKSDEFWQQYDSKQELAEKVEFVKVQIKDILRKLLQLEDCDTIEDEANFQDVGVDSLMFVELKNAVQALLGNRVSVNASALRDCSNAKLLSEKLTTLIEGMETEQPVNPPTFDEVNELMREDCQLPENITAVGRSVKNISQIEKVLLTGVTGHLGPHILKELTQMRQVREVFCLIRPTKSMSLEQRLEKALQFQDLVGAVDMQKVRYVAGNVSSQNLGMDRSDWEELTETIDGVFHCAVKANHTQYYKKGEPSVEDVRSVNVIGTKNILEFASSGQIKHIYMASSLASTVTTAEDGTLNESWPEIGDFDQVTNFAYPISKFVTEVLLKAAVIERGIPAKVFRFPYISGDSKSGKIKIDNNHFILRYLFILKTGVMQSNPFPMMLLPVDTCASISCKIFFNDKAASASGIYNITHPSPNLDQDFVSIAQGLGYSVDIIEFEEFAKKILAEPDDSVFAMFKECYKNEQDIMGMYTTTAMRSWLNGVDNFFVSKKVFDIFPDYSAELSKTVEYLERDLKFAREKGWLQLI